ncbi:PTS sugar transporter subunit IIA, partial [Bacillus altitudinis]|uniref:PTS sugar transporter subunit IIA n=1 Tax=Bacillus altitudinis TaxID=293387 RepID=UPI001F1C9F41
MPHTKTSPVQTPSLLFLQLQQPIQSRTFHHFPTTYLFTLLLPLQHPNLTHLKLLSPIPTTLIHPPFIQNIQPPQTPHY